MNKTKMTLAVVGGAAGLVVLVAAFLAWRSSSARTVALEGDVEEGIDGLETAMEQARSLSHKDVYPCAASVAAIASNRTLVATWETEAQELAARGDKTFEPTTPPAFKSFIVSDARRLMNFPGRVDGRIAKPDFAFGPFKSYIAEGKMPDKANLVELQRQWDDVATVVEILATNGVVELTDVQIRQKAEKEDPKARNRRRPSNSGVSRQTAGAPSSFTYVFSFAAKPAAFVRAINALETAERFIVVDDFEFVRPSDTIAESLAGEDKKAQTRGTAARRSGRRRGVAVTEDTKEEAKKENGIVTDPVLDAPLSVSLTVSVYDFRSLEDEKTEEGGK